MRRSMRIRKTGLFQDTYREEGDGSHTEIRETLAQEEHIKRMPTGQMEMLSPDRLRVSCTGMFTFGSRFTALAYGRSRTSIPN